MPKRTFNRTRKPRRKFFALFLQGVLLLVLIFVLIGVGTFVLFAKDLPDPSRIDERVVSQSTKIYDREGKVILYDIHGEEKRTVIPFQEIPDHVRQAAISIEDQNFYNHPGIDVKAILRALISNITSDGLQGGSTITQQFIKKSILSDERTLVRKIKEAILALELERKYSKDEILGFYLNQIPYGSNAYGIEAAAQTYFAKHANELSVAEGALLAALPKAPTYYSPYSSHIEDLMDRKNLVLDRMRDLGYITPEEAEDARNHEYEFSEARTAINAPHFVFYVREILESLYGEEYLSRAGLKITTTIDWELQTMAEKIVREQAERNTSLGAHNAALVAIDPKTGDILAMVGSKSYFEDSFPEGCTPGVNCRFEPNVNVVIRDRQPGSSFKPFVYATAFKKGYTDKTIVFDVPTEFNSTCSPSGSPTTPGAQCYNPQNYDSLFRGPVTLRQALSNSLNIPAVKTLYLAGVDESINTAHDMGITTLNDRDRYGLSLVLGGGEVKLIDMVSSYGVFATEGERVPHRAIIKIEASDGEVIEEEQSEATRVLDRQIAREITDILSDNQARTPVFGPSSVLAFPGRTVAAKTRTTNQFRDGWTIGYTPSLVVGVWVGNNNNVSMNAPGVSVAAPIWREFLLGAIEKLGISGQEFNPPDPRSGNKPILNSQHVVNGEVHTILHYIQKDDPLGLPPISRDPQYENWEFSVRSLFGSILPDQPSQDSDNEEDQKEVKKEDSSDE